MEDSRWYWGSKSEMLLGHIERRMDLLKWNIIDLLFSYIIV